LVYTSHPSSSAVNLAAEEAAAPIAREPSGRCTTLENIPSAQGTTHLADTLARVACNTHELGPTAALYASIISALQK
jgi:hypothetical protein